MEKPCKQRLLRLYRDDSGSGRGTEEAKGKIPQGGARRFWPSAQRKSASGIISGLCTNPTPKLAKRKRPWEKRERGYLGRERGGETVATIAPDMRDQLREKNELDWKNYEISACNRLLKELGMKEKGKRAEKHRNFRSRRHPVNLRNQVGGLYGSSLKTGGETVN